MSNHAEKPNPDAGAVEVQSAISTVPKDPVERMFYDKKINYED